jgi:glycosyltransferase involved in cell wall biosynthesis
LTCKLGISDYVTFTGKISEKRKIQEYHNADVLVVPSNFEPFGIVILEAYASSTPVIASNVGGIPELIANGKTGLLVPPKNPQELAEAVLKVLQNKNMSSRLGKNGRKKAEHFSWESITKKIEKIYLSIT